MPTPCKVLNTLLAALLTITSATAVAQDEPQSRIVSIGTGSLTGVYYPAGGAICRLMNRNFNEHGIRCLVESTDGSVYNLNKIHNGELAMGIVQSDWQYHAYHGSSEFAAKGPNKDLRAIFSLHGEPFTVVARVDSGIKTFDDLKGKRVNIGNPGSGQRATLEVLMQAKNWDTSVFAETTELEAVDQAQALCDDDIDAIIYTVGHPNGSVLEATTACDSVLVTVDDDIVDQLINDNPYYSRTIIPAGMYRGNPNDVVTFGVRATLVTSVSLPEAVVYQVVKAVFDNFDGFRKLHPALANLDRQTMTQDGNSAPLHPGAERYFHENGLL